MNWLWALAFLLTLAECAVGAKYTQCVAGQRAIAAASWGALFEFLLLVDVYFMVESYWLAIPIVCGAWLGVYWTVKK